MGLVIGGLATGGVYTLISLGLVVIFRATGIVNFAQGQLMMLGAYAYVLVASHTSSSALQMGTVVVAGCAAGLVSYVVVHVLLRRADELVIVLGTFGLGLLVEAIVRIVYTDNPKSARGWLTGDTTVSIFGSRVTENALVTIGLAIVLAVVLSCWFRFTMSGKSMEAVAEDAQVAGLTGIRVRRTLLASWALSGVFAALGGLLVAPITGAYPAMGTSMLLPAFFVVVIGGLENIPGALAGGLILGLLQTYTVVWIGGAFRDLVIFVILLAVLLVRPNGIFGALSLRRF